MDSKLQLRLNNYGSDDSGRLICSREPAYRYAHEQIGVIQINAPKGFATKIVAALDEPAACVGVSATVTVILFRAVRKAIRSQLDFIIKGKQLSLSITLDGGPIDLAGFSWPNDRSPLTVPYSALPPLFDDHVDAASTAVKNLLPEFGGTFGTLPTAAEIAAAEETEKRHAKLREEIAAGYWTDEAVAAREDEELAARWHPDMSMHDGVFSQNIIAAYRRVQRRKSGTTPPVRMTGA